MRIAYITVHVAPEIMQGGVGKKIKTQMRIWRELGHEVTLFSLTPAEIPFPEERQFVFDAKTSLLKREANRASGLMRMLDAIREYKPDVIYLRFGLYSYPLHRLFKIAPVVLETNSDDQQEYQKRGTFFYWMNRLTRGLTFGSASGIITPSHELVDVLLPKRDKPFRVISNGIDLTQAEALPPTNNKQPVITMVCSPGMKWHGVDKLMRFAENTPDVVVNLVGYSEKDIDAPAPSNVKLYGFLDKQGVRDVLAQTDVALGTLALHRNQMQEASVLKVREALAYGIPVVIAFYDTDLHDVKLDTILRIPNTEENVAENSDGIRKFAYEMIGKRVDINSVSPYLDQRKKEEARLEFFKQIIQVSL
ncbi:MAG: glycosyltransferase family 4 protein [Anaerolineales bacterium]|nr:glycosyltransferase family 4 protein [Anaerolineales bacterium]